MSASSLIMIRPACFGSNPETMEDNVFQKQGNSDEVAKLALLEFDRMVSTLRSKGMEVLVLEDFGDPKTYDSVFPNNWFSTHADGQMYLYPMKSSMRRLERRPEFIEKITSLFEVNKINDLSAYEEEGRYLEGTGSMVLDHEAKIAYMCHSERSSEMLLSQFCGATGFRPFVFDCVIDGKPVYHTNVVMGVGSNFIVACAEAFDQREAFEERVRASGKQLITISIEQVKSFMGNCLEVSSEDGTNYLVISETAYQSLSSAQIKSLEKWIHILPISIPTIETYGGGSVRCMIAENYLTKKEQTIHA